MNIKALVLLIISILYFSVKLPGQENSGSVNSDTIVYKTSEIYSVPEFVYSKGKLQKEKIKAYIKDNQMWPNQADGVYTVYVKFIVEKDGTLSNVSVFKGIHPDFDKEAVKLIKAMPKWKPGINWDKQAIRVEMILPVKWTIFDE